MVWIIPRPGRDSFEVVLAIELETLSILDDNILESVMVFIIS